MASLAGAPSQVIRSIGLCARREGFETHCVRECFFTEIRLKWVLATGEVNAPMHWPHVVRTFLR